MFGGIPDNYDLWEQRDREQEDWRERLPKCSHCMEPIQQEMATCLDGNWLCDECISINRKEVNAG